jgi:hypothetical protein
MKNKLNHIFLGLMVITMLTWSSCKDDDPKCYDETNPECENYDPCHGKREINTFFKVRPGDRGFKPPGEWCKLIPCDTFNASSVRFDAPDGNPENSTYTWQIGSEAEPRTGKSFEIDFSDYLDENGWETWIPITLTIRTPMNECLRSEEETEKTVTRDLFFTNTLMGFFTNLLNNEKVYLGYANNNPKEEVICKFIKMENGTFRGYERTMFLVTGLPGIDTLAFPSGCQSESCSSSKQVVARYFPETTCMTDVSNYLYQASLINKNGHEEIELELYFGEEASVKKIKFNGNLMK